MSVSASAAGKQQRPSNSYVRPIIPVPIKLIAVSKGGSKSLDEVAEEWSAKIRRYAPFAISTIKPNPKGSADPDQQKEGEAERVLKQIQPKDYVVLLDERGREVSSLDMTDVLEQVSVAETCCVVSTTKELALADSCSSLMVPRLHL